MLPVKVRNALITAFVVAWTLLFHYESLRLTYLTPLVGTELPKFKFLFPPAGWIMFYHVHEAESRAEVLGFRGGQPEAIDPHRIFENRWLGYDNIRRNVLVTVLGQAHAASFCRYLRRKFPEYERFAVAYVVTPSYRTSPEAKQVQIAYAC
jgi:hypothetical protein